MHQWLADELDFDVMGDTRPAGVWQMAGRCIGIAQLIIDALALGYTRTEVQHLARALHEADRLVDIFGIPEEADLLRKWLADEGDEWVRPRAVREAEKRFEKRLAKAMREAGVPELRRTDELTRRIYGQHSEAAHHRRKWTQDAVAPQLRTMIRGRTTVWARRAVGARKMLGIVEESVASVGDALAPFFGPGWYEQHVIPVLASFEALRVTHPLP